MWNLYCLQKETGTRASDLLGVSAWAEEVSGLPDILTALAFDRAVTFVGGYIEGKLMERNAKGEPLYSLEYLLKERDAEWWQKPNTAGLLALGKALAG